MEILLAGKTDMEEILNLQKRAFLSEAKLLNDYEIQPLKETIEELLEELKSKIFYKAILNNKIVGSVRGELKNETFYIGKLIVDPDYQNQGIGTALLKRIEMDFLTYRKEIFTSDKSIKNITFYKKNGYQEFKQIKVSETLTMIYLEKENVK